MKGSSQFFPRSQSSYETVQAKLASAAAKGRDFKRRELIAKDALLEMIAEAEFGAPGRMIRAAEHETLVARIHAALQRRDVDEAIRLCIGAQP